MQPGVERRRESPRHRVTAITVAMLCTVVGFAACGDGPTEGRSPIVGRYTLATVNGEELPWSGMIATTGPAATVTSGDLVLRADGSFGVGLVGAPPYFQLGRYSVDSTTAAGERALTLHYLVGPTEADSARAPLVMSGDSLIWAMPPAEGFLGVRFAFVRSAAAAPAVRGKFALTSVDADATPPFVIFDVPDGEGRLLVAAGFDTLTFNDDGVFYQQHRAEHSLHVDADGDTTVFEAIEWSTHGTYSRSPAGALVLRPFFSMWRGRPTDTLSVVLTGTALERRWVHGEDTFTERLTRVP
jgi:hypothetical protein